MRWTLVQAQTSTNAIIPGEFTRAVNFNEGECATSYEPKGTYGEIEKKHCKL